MAIVCVTGIIALQRGSLGKGWGLPAMTASTQVSVQETPSERPPFSRGSFEHAVDDSNGIRPPTWRHPGGKNLQNGSLSVENTPEQRIRLYSAFFDDREISASHVPFIIRVLATFKEQHLQRARYPFQCVLYCADNTSTPELIKIDVKDRRRLSDTKVVNTTRYNSFILTIRPTQCSSYLPRIWVGMNNDSQPFDWHKFLQESPSVDIEESHRVPERFELGLCTPTFFHLDPYRVVEWIEMQRILGVTGIILYNTSINAETSRVLSHYYSLGHIDVRLAWRLEEKFFLEDIWLLNQLVLNDCLYRYMHTFKYIMVIDPDEVILPRGFSTLPAMLSTLSRKHPDVVDFHFSQAFFVTEKTLGAKPDFSKPVHSFYMRYRHRTQFRWNKSYHLKSIFIPEHCQQAFNHYCASQYHVDASKNTTTFVDTDIAYIHHYREALDTKPHEFFAKNGTLRRPNITLDNTILAFEDQLLASLTERLDLLGL